MRALKTKLRQSVHHEANDLLDARYTNLIVQLKDLGNINRIHMHYINWIRSKSSIVRLPTLFSEIFDIPISSKSSSSSAISESIGDDSLVNDEYDESGVEEHRDDESTRIKTAGDNDENEETGGTSTQSLSPSSSRQTNRLNVCDQPDRNEFFFNLASFQDSDDKIEASDLNPTVDCLSDIVDQLTSQ